MRVHANGREMIVDKIIEHVPPQQAGFAHAAVAGQDNLNIKEWRRLMIIVLLVIDHITSTRSASES
jgi:hypothetical protein